MRKLAAVEVVALVSAFAVGHADPGDEPPFQLPTVTVVGNYNPDIDFRFNPAYNISPAIPPTPIGYLSTPETEQNSHALECAEAYGQPGYKGPKEGFTTHVTPNYGWRRGPPWGMRSTPTATPPAGWEGAEMVNGLTFPESGVSYVFEGNLDTTDDLIHILAHEWAHQWGADEAQAVAAADYAVNAYNADDGAECGGLMD